MLEYPAGDDQVELRIRIRKRSANLYHFGCIKEWVLKHCIVDVAAIQTGTSSLKV